MTVREWSGSALDDQLHISPARVLIPEAFPVPVAPTRERRAIAKPNGGLWTSTLRPGPSSAWVEWCRDEQFDDPDALTWHVLTPDPAARILVIDSLADLIVTTARYPLPLAWDRERCEIDFVAVAADGFAAVHLTERGNAECHSVSYPVPPGISTLALNTWDCESTAWLRWAFAAAVGWGRVTRVITEDRGCPPSACSSATPATGSPSFPSGRSIAS